MQILHILTQNFEEIYFFLSFRGFLGGVNVFHLEGVKLTIFSSKKNIWRCLL